jgi:hypothetical protein
MNADINILISASEFLIFTHMQIFGLLLISFHFISRPQYAGSVLIKGGIVIHSL